MAKKIQITEQTERFVEIYRELKRNEVFVIDADAADKMGYGRGNLNAIINKRLNASIEAINKFCTAFDVNKYYIYDGTLPKFKNPTKEEITEIGYLRQLVKQKDETIELLKENIQLLKRNK